MTYLIKFLYIFFMGLLAILEPTIKFAGVLLFAILIDCYSAYDLSRRLKKQYPDKVDGKFQSQYALKMFNTFFKAFSVIVLAHLIDVVILHNFSYLNLSNIVAAVFCALQGWSILENFSSANGARWAKVLQKIMVDKTQRHFDINLEINENESNNNNTN